MKGRDEGQEELQAHWQSRAGPPPADGDVPPVPRGSLSAPLRATLPRGPSGRDDGFLSLPSHWSICLSPRQEVAWAELAGSRCLIQLLVGHIHPATGTWTHPSLPSASFLPSFPPNPQTRVGLPSPRWGPWGRSSHPKVLEEHTSSP